MSSPDNSRDPSALFALLASFTNDGTPLEALVGSKVEWGVTVLTAGMLANTNLAASMTPEEMVDGAINYYNLVQERLAYYRSNQVHSLEKMIDS
tara:strand:- start:298 stop:579 length:282 start_codon:yes stop_codon:yes gene_type:complete